MSRRKRGAPGTPATAEAVARKCIAVRVRLINRAITSIYDEALRPLGLRISQMNILVAVARLGLAKPGDLSRSLLMDKSTLSRDVERMQRRGWLVAVAARDGRSHLLRLTPKGNKLLAAATPAWRRAQRKARVLLGADGVAAAARIADDLRSRAIAAQTQGAPPSDR